MKQTGMKETVIKEIRMLAKRHGIEKVILFGSRARGDYHRASDIDLAVCGGDVTAFALDVEEETSTLLRFDIVDLGKELKESFLDEIRRDGIAIYEEV